MVEWRAAGTNSLPKELHLAARLAALSCKCCHPDWAAVRNIRCFRRITNIARLGTSLLTHHSPAIAPNPTLPPWPHPKKGGVVIDSELPEVRVGTCGCVL